MAATSTPRKPSANAVPVLVPAGSHAGKPSLPLGRPFTLIGSRHRAHLHLLSRTVSKSHAAIVSTESGLYIRDLASRERVFVNNQQVREAVLADGDVLRVGAFNFKYKDPAAKRRPLIGRRAPAGELHVDGSNIPLPIESRTLVIGRRPTCDVPLIELAASTIHAIIFESNGQRFIRDLGSRTGTFVNGATVHQRVLNDGDEIKIGETSVRYAVTAKAEEPPVEVAEAVGVGQETGVLDLAPPAVAHPHADQVDLSAEDDDEDEYEEVDEDEEEAEPEPVRPAAKVTKPAPKVVKPAAKAPKPVATPPKREPSAAFARRERVALPPPKHAEPETIPLAMDDDLLPLASDDDLIPLPEPPAPQVAAAAAPVPLDLAAAAAANEAQSAASEPAAAAPVAMDAARLDDGDDDRHILVGTDLHQEKLSGSGSFADVEANLEESEGEDTAASMNLDWWPQDANAATNGAEPQRAAPAPVAEESSLAHDEPISLHSEEPASFPDTAASQERDHVLTANAGAIGESAESAELRDLGFEQTAPTSESATETTAIPEAVAPETGEPPPQRLIATPRAAAWDVGDLALSEEPQGEEFLSSTEPTPESAQALEPRLGTDEVFPLEAEDLGAIEPQPVADLSDTRFEASVKEFSDAASEPLVEVPTEPAIEQSESAAASVHEEIAPPGEAVTTDVLASEAPAENSPYLSSLLSEDEQTGDAIVDSAAAFLEHEQSTRHEASLQAGEHAPVAESTITSAVETAEAPSVETTADDFSIANPVSTAASLPAIQEPEMAVPEDMVATAPDAEEIVPMASAEAELEPAGNDLAEAPAITAPLDVIAEVSEPLVAPPPVESAVTADVLVPEPVAEVSAEAPDFSEPQETTAAGEPVESFELPATDADELPTIDADEQPAIETAEVPRPMIEELETPFTEPDIEPDVPEFSAEDAAPLITSEPEATTTASEAEATVEPIAADPEVEDLAPLSPPLADLEPLDLAPVHTAAADVLSEYAEPAIAPAPEETTVTSDVSLPEALETEAIEEHPGDIGEALELAPADEVQPLVETHPHSEFTSSEAAPIAAPPEAQADIVSEAPETLEPEVEIPAAEERVAGEQVEEVPLAGTFAEANAPAEPENQAKPPPAATLSDLLGGMSRDAGSFLGGLPLGFGPVVGPSVMPAKVKLKQDVVEPPPELKPAPIGKVEPELPSTKIIGVPPKVKNEPAEMFDDPTVLDSITDELTPIGDLTDILGEKAVLPPNILEQPTVKTPPPSPKSATPPPARTTRAVTAFDGLDEIDLEELQPLSADVGEMEEPLGAPSAFDGLAMGPTSPVDAFSLLPLPEEQDPFGNVPISESAGTATPAPRPARAGRQPGSQIVPPAPTRQQQEPLKKKKKWKFFGSILLLAFAGGAGATWLYWPYQIQTVGTLRFDGVNSTAPDVEHPISEGDSVLEDQRFAMLTPAKGILPRAIELATSSRIDPGFLNDGVRLEKVGGSSAVDKTTSSIIIRHRGRDADAERIRMKSLLLAAFEANSQRNQTTKDRQSKLDAIEGKLPGIQADIDQIKANQARVTELQQIQRSSQAVRDKLALAEITVTAAAAKLRNVQEEAARPQEALSIEPLMAEADPELTDLAGQIQQIDARLALLRSGAGIPAKASETLSTALTDILTQLDSTSASRQPGTPLTDYLETAQAVAQQIRREANEFLNSQKTNSDSLADLRRQQSQKNQVRMAAVFNVDPQLLDLRQKWTIKDRQANTAADAGLSAQAASLRADSAALVQQMERRKNELTPPDAASMALQSNIDSVSGQLKRQQDAFTQRLSDQAQRLSAAANSLRKLSSGNRATVAALNQKFIQAQAAASLLAAAAGPNPADVAKLSSDFSSQRTALAAKSEDRRKRIADDAADRIAIDRAQLATSKTRRSVQLLAQTEMDHATADRDAVKKELATLEAKSASIGPVNVAENLRLPDLVGQQTKMRADKAKLESTPAITVRDPVGSEDSVQIEKLNQTPRLAATAALGSMGLVLFSFFWRRP